MNWKELKVSELCESIIDCVNKTAPKSEYITPYKMIRTTNVRHGRLDLDKVFFVEKDIFEKWNRRGKPQINDVILTREAPVGEVAMLKTDDEVFLGQRTMMYRANETRITPRFLFYSLTSDFVQDQLHALSSGSTVAHVKVGDAQSFIVKTPPLPTQKRIADILSAYDDLIENNLKRIKLLEQAAQNIYKEWFVYMRFPGHEDAVMDEETGLPEGWELNTFYDTVDIMSGGTPKTREALYWNGKIPFFTPKDASAISQWYIEVTQKTLTKEGLAKCNSKLYPIDTVFITARGTVGKVRLAMQPMAMNQSCYALKMKNDSSQYFLLGALQEAVRLLKKTAIGGVFDTIIVDTFKQIPFLQPTEKLINKFHETVSPIIKQTATLSKEISKLKAARDILLPRLMNRTIEV